MCIVVIGTSFLDFTTHKVCVQFLGSTTVIIPKLVDNNVGRRRSRAGEIYSIWVRAVFAGELDLSRQ
jgi:hypothetical protein